MNTLFRGIERFFNWQITIVICLLFEANFIWMAYIENVELALISFVFLIAKLLFGLNIKEKKTKENKYDT